MIKNGGYITLQYCDLIGQNNFFTMREWLHTPAANQSQH